MLVTEWSQLAELDWKEAAARMRNPLLIDGRNMLDPAAMREAGFTYEGIGRNGSSSLAAVILVGGLGTRLRPLTDLTRKDMLPLVDRPQLAYTFEHLRRFGVTRAIVSCGYLPTQIQEHFGDRYGDLRLEYRIEEEPLGTGGAIRFAAEDVDETFLALNGDSLRETDLDALLSFHRERDDARDDPAHAGRGSLRATGSCA